MATRMAVQAADRGILSPEILRTRPRGVRATHGAPRGPEHCAAGKEARHPPGTVDALPGDSVRCPTASLTSLRLPHKLTLERWIGIGRDLSTTTSSAAWWLGDWLIYGEAAFTGRYRNAIEQTSLDYKTLRNYAWVARRFPPDRRHETLSFGHHAEVAALAAPEQDFWLRKAATLSWSRNKLRRIVRESLREREESPIARHRDGAPHAIAPGRLPPLPHEADDPPPAERLSVRLTHQQLAAIRQAADCAQVPVDTWAARILLKEAARSAVGKGGDRERPDA
ncbi:LmbU family transcriptional regulator [Actinospica sp. MGRD01-02]|uniref:LmbU family transcriptional regulator n=1 Tax=Actinospica acidithermotolerans TaxID=2828514 RepID=A0A941E4D0_9ACTN|nr:LmbU family transcriptional regulator [Actinospica acidithermotolerans]MBR7825995.1 LmbU family transcriptional regulator [Actinospica acidithermotolerans]